jgi:hypothetical protein
VRRGVRAKQVSDEEGPNSVGYFISRQNDIILGGTAIKGRFLLFLSARLRFCVIAFAHSLRSRALYAMHTDDWSTNVDHQTTEDILRKVENLSAGKLRKENLEILEVLVGLRPARYALMHLCP